MPSHSKILITGIEGFTGQHLDSYLSNHGYEVYGATLDKPTKPNYFQCDITVTDEICAVLQQIKPDYIIHLSAISFVAHKDMEAFYKVNTIGTLNLLEELLKLEISPKKVILASSATVYGNQNQEILDESMCPKPANHYGASKYAMESLSSNYFDKLPIIITRPFNYTGINQDKNFLIPKIVSHYKEKLHSIELGNLDVVREFNDIEFVCEVYHKLLLTPHHSEVVNISTSRGIKLLDIIKMMNKIARYDIDVKVNPKFVRKDEIKLLIGSNKKLTKMIGDIDIKSFEDTLRTMFETP
jgi:nucleoside-diphosphate-sugar epimerase